MSTEGGDPGVDDGYREVHYRHGRLRPRVPGASAQGVPGAPPPPPSQPAPAQGWRPMPATAVA
eukprot:7951447-Lingulodinium_polyedra.AAC.1